MNRESPFTLNSADDNFLQRQKNVFDQLNVLEKNAKNNVKNTIINEEPEDMVIDENPRNHKRGNRSATKHFRGKESIFKKPQNVRPKGFFQKMPDFKKNPHKWTKYSLGDVNEADMSEKSNTKTALSFLKELESRNKNMDCNEDKEVPTKILFKKKCNKNTNETNIEDKSSFRSSKVIMPEYTVGQKVKKEKKQGEKSRQISKGKELKLDHLLDDEDE